MNLDDLLTARRADRYARGLERAARTGNVVYLIGGKYEALMRPPFSPMKRGPATVTLFPVRRRRARASRLEDTTST